MKETQTEERLPAVSTTTRRGREVPARWAWTEPSVWTERMLDALERGVKGGKWYSLIDKVLGKETLAAAWGRVRRNRGSAGVDGITIPYFERHLEDQLLRLHEELRSGTYKPEAIRRVEIPKPGSRETTYRQSNAAAMAGVYIASACTGFRPSRISL